MKSKQLMFFALLEDIENVLSGIETSIDILYYKTGLFDSKNIFTYKSLFDAPSIGIVFSGDWNKIDSYLAIKTTTQLVIRDVPQRKGEMMFAVDQLKNPKSIEVKVGGIFQGMENVIVAGRIATVSDDIDSNELYQLFTAKIKRSFKKIGTFYVGRNVEEKLKEGWRLVTNEKSPKEYDLAFPTRPRL